MIIYNYAIHFDVRQRGVTWHLEHRKLIPQCPCFCTPPLLIAVDDHQCVCSAALHNTMQTSKRALARYEAATRWRSCRSAASTLLGATHPGDICCWAACAATSSFATCAALALGSARAAVSNVWNRSCVVDKRCHLGGRGALGKQTDGRLIQTLSILQTRRVLAILQRRIS